MRAEAELPILVQPLTVKTFLTLTRFKMPGHLSLLKKNIQAYLEQIILPLKPAIPSSPLRHLCRLFPAVLPPPSYGGASFLALFYPTRGGCTFISPTLVGKRRGVRAIAPKVTQE